MTERRTIDLTSPTTQVRGEQSPHYIKGWLKLARIRMKKWQKRLEIIQTIAMVFSVLAEIFKLFERKVMC